MVAKGYKTFYITELMEQQCVLRLVWIRFANAMIASLNEWNELPEILVLPRCYLNIGQGDIAWGVVSVAMNDLFSYLTCLDVAFSERKRDDLLPSVD